MKIKKQTSKIRLSKLLLVAVRFVRELSLIQNSIICQDIVLHILHKHFLGEMLNFKELSLLVSFSEVSVRNHIIELERMGWIKIVGADHDKRVKYIQPSEKLLERWKDLAHRYQKQMSDLRNIDV